MPDHSPTPPPPLLGPLSEERSVRHRSSSRGDAPAQPPGSPIRRPDRGTRQGHPDPAGWGTRPMRPIPGQRRAVNRDQQQRAHHAGHPSATDTATAPHQRSQLVAHAAGPPGWPRPAGCRVRTKSRIRCPSTPSTSVKRHCVPSAGSSRRADPNPTTSTPTALALPCRPVVVHEDLIFIDYESMTLGNIAANALLALDPGLVVVVHMGDPAVDRCGSPVQSERCFLVRWVPAACLARRARRELALDCWSLSTAVMEKTMRAA